MERPTRHADFEGVVDPVQTKLFMLVMLACLLFTAQLMTQAGAFAALP